MPLRSTSAAWLALALSGLCACGSERPAARAERPAPVVGFVYVGTVDDHGYNEAAHDGALAVRKAFPEGRVMEVEEVPETVEAESVMQGLIDRGATVVVATSFGHLEPAMNVAAANPDVTFLHQGGLQTAPNLGTYFATIWEAQYVAGQAAGLVTETDRLGFVAAFPIAQSLLSINAFHLGARSVNPRVRTSATFTSSWCRPARQRAAARRLLAGRVDVLAQHQDCTGPVLRSAEARGVWAVGYHADASAVAPGAWLTGAMWNWGPTLVGAVRAAASGSFAGSRFAGRLRVGAREGAVGLAPFGRRVPASVTRRARATWAAVRAGRVRPFDGPLRDRDGRVRITGAQPPVAVLEEMDYLVAGVDRVG